MKMAVMTVVLMKAPMVWMAFLLLCRSEPGMEHILIDQSDKVRRCKMSCETRVADHAVSTLLSAWGRTAHRNQET